MSSTNTGNSAASVNPGESLTGSESIKAFVRLKPSRADGSEEIPVLDQGENNKVIDKEHNQTYEFGKDSIFNYRNCIRNARQ
jgi:hypothetical protein